MIKSKFLFLLIALCTLVFSSKKLSAHGYVVSPAARGYQGSLDKATLGYNVALGLYGNVINDPQSLEAPKGYPAFGPSDGHIASAGGVLGDTVLDNQTADRWKKTNISTGVNTFIWKYTANHHTAKWHYYMTKPGWNPNKPLTRNDLELIGEIMNDGSQPEDNTPHHITVPSNRQGYHIILAVWDVFDTANAFYNVIDVNVTPDTGIPTPPSTPTGLAKEFVTNSMAKISWTPQNDATSYIVFRNGNAVKEVSVSEIEDSGLDANTTYIYNVQAKGISGLVSEKSADLSVKTLDDETIEKPTPPKHLHSMGVTENSASIMWMASTHSQGIKNYEVFQNNIKIAETNQTSFLSTGLSANTEYRYTVKAIAKTGEVSDFSNELKIKTKESDNGGTYCGAQTYNPANAYPTAHTKVFYSCRIWENKWYANPQEFPGESMVWEEVSICTEGPDCEDQLITYCGAYEYDSKKAYSTAATKVFYDCKIWENQWYANPGELPGENSVWKVVSSCNEGPNCLNAKSNEYDNLSVIVSANYINFSPENYYGKISKVEIFTTGGLKVISSVRPGKNTINIASLQQGVYFMTVTFIDGTSVMKTIKK